MFNRFLLIVALFNQCRTNARNGDYSGLSCIGLLISGGLPVGDSLKLQKKRTFGTGNNKDAMGADLSNSQNISPGAEPLILNLSSNIYSSDITQQIEVMRWNFFEESGIPLPKIIVNPVKNNDSAIEFLLYQESIYKDTLIDDTVYFEAGHAEISFEFVQKSFRLTLSYIRRIRLINSSLTLQVWMFMQQQMIR